jgi:DNA replication protein DnaC
MSFPGGAADKDGNRYEARWGVLKLLEVLAGKADSIEIEPQFPRLKGIEFILKRGEITEYHQAKRQLAGRPGLTVFNLKELGILDTLWKYTSQENDRFCFISTLSCGVVDELMERQDLAFQRQKEESGELTDLLAKSHAEERDRLRDHYKTSDVSKDELASMKDAKVDQLICQHWQRVIPTPLKEEHVEEWALDKARYLVHGKPEHAVNALRKLYEDSNGRIIRATDIREFLKHEKVRCKDASDTTLVQTLKQRNQAFCEHDRLQVPELPRDALIDSIMEKITSGSGQRVFITGDAGSGKSFILQKIADRLGKQSVPCLALRLDNIEEHNNVVQIGRSLGFESSPVAALMQQAQTNPCVLILDQLDDVSVSSGRSPIKQAGVIELLREASVHDNLTVVLGCREYHLQHDDTLKRLKRDGDIEQAIPEVSEHEVRTACLQLGIAEDRLTPELLTLLRIPLFFVLFTGIEDPNNTPITTRQDLLEQFYHSKQRAVGDNLWYEVLDKFFDVFMQTSLLSIPRKRFGRCESALDRMLAEHVMIERDGRIAFFHQEFLDYAFYCWFEETGGNLRDFICQSDQGLHLRAPLRTILVNRFRENDRTFEDTIISLLENPGIRTHLKQITLDAVKQVSFVSDRLFTTVQGMESQEELSGWPGYLFDRSPSWFDFLLEKGLIKEWWESEDLTYSNRAHWLLRDAVKYRSSEVGSFCLEYVERSEEWRIRVCNLLVNQLKPTPSDELGAVWRILISSGLIRKHSQYPDLLMDEVFETFAKQKPELAASLLGVYYEELIAALGPLFADDRDEPHEEPISKELDKLHTKDILPLAETATQALLDTTLPLFEFLLPIGDSPQGKLFHFLFELRHRTHGKDWYDAVDTVILPIEKALVHLAKYNPDRFRHYLNRLIALQKDDYTAFSICLAFAEGSTELVPDTVKYILESPGRMKTDYGIWHHPMVNEEDEDSLSSMSEVVTGPGPGMLSKVARECSTTDFVAIERAILGFFPDENSDPNDLDEREWWLLDKLGTLPVERMRKESRELLDDLRLKRDRLYPPSPRHDPFAESRSPVTEEQAKNLSEAEWLDLIIRYSTEPLKSAAVSLAELSMKMTAENPAWFISLANRFTPEVHRQFIGTLFRGLAKTQTEHQAVFDLIRKFATWPEYPGAIWIAEWVQTIAVEDIPEDILLIMVELATKPSDPTDPTPEKEYNTSYLGHGTVRGQAAITITELIHTKPERIPLFTPYFETLVKDVNPGVRSWVAGILYQLWFQPDRFPRERTLTLFRDLIDIPVDELLASHYVGYFVNAATIGEEQELLDVLERMVKSSRDSVRTLGARLVFACACGQRERLQSLLDTCLKGDLALHKGLTKEAIHFSRERKNGALAVEVLNQLLAAREKDVIVKIGYMFDKEHEYLLKDYPKFIEDFASVVSYGHNSLSLFKLLSSAEKTPINLIVTVANRIVERANEAMRSREILPGCLHQIPGLIQTALENTQNQTQKTTLLDIWDQLAGRYPRMVDERN